MKLYHIRKKPITECDGGVSPDMTTGGYSTLTNTLGIGDIVFKDPETGIGNTPMSNPMVNTKTYKRYMDSLSIHPNKVIYVNKRKNKKRKNRT